MPARTCWASCATATLAVTPAIVSLVLAAIDRIKAIVAGLAQPASNPPGDDCDADRRAEAAAAERSPAPRRSRKPQAADPERRRRSRRAAAHAGPEARGAPAAEKPAATGRRQRAAGRPDHPRHRRRAGRPDDPGQRTGADPQPASAARPHAGEQPFTVPLQRLSHITSDLQEGVMKTRMQPIGNAWNKLPRLVRDLSHEMGKKIELTMLGADTELDRQVLETDQGPADPHGAQQRRPRPGNPAERRAAGKPETGSIALNAFHEGGHIIIEIADDGRGLPVDRIRAKALQHGLATEAELAAMTDGADPALHLPRRLLHRRHRHRRLRPRRRHGRGEDQHREDRRHHRPEEHARPGHDLHRQDPADPGDRLRADRRSRRGSASPFRRSAWSNWCAPAAAGDGAGSAGESLIERINDTPVLRLRNRLLPLVSLTELLQLGVEQPPTAPPTSSSPRSAST